MTIIEFDRKFPNSQIALIGNKFKTVYDFVKDFSRKNPGLRVNLAKRRVVLPNGSVVVPCVPSSLDTPGQLFDAAFVYGPIQDTDELDLILFSRVKNLDNVYTIKELK